MNCALSTTPAVGCHPVPPLVRMGRSERMLTALLPLKPDMISKEIYRKFVGSAQAGSSERRGQRTPRSEKGRVRSNRDGEDGRPVEVAFFAGDERVVERNAAGNARGVASKKYR